METLREAFKASLNPCFCGSWFLSFRLNNITIRKHCLNPCFCGSWFLRILPALFHSQEQKVLILVFVEVGFWVHLQRQNVCRDWSLNPCFCGSWFLSIGRIPLRDGSSVLILVFVEVGFWVFMKKLITKNGIVLILVFVEVGFWEDNL